MFFYDVKGPVTQRGRMGERSASALEICNFGQCVVVRPTFVEATASGHQMHGACSAHTDRP